MGHLISKLPSNLRVFDIKILILGLRKSGKTSILNQILNNEITNPEPTLVDNIQNKTFNNYRITFEDISQQLKSEKKVFNVNGIIYVIDSTNNEQFEESKSYLLELMNNFSNIPFLIYSNKSDLNNSITVTELVYKLQIQQLTGKKWYVQQSNCSNGEGVEDGFKWLLSNFYIE